MLTSIINTFTYNLDRYFFMKKVIVQDGTREEQMAKLFNLTRKGGRIGIDAEDEKGNHYELKSTTKGGVSTARDLGPNHLKKWRTRYWIIQSGHNTKKGFIFESTHFLAPVHMEEWYKKIEEKLKADMKLTRLTKRLLKKAGILTKEQIERVDWLMHRGKLMNDPNIPKGYIRNNGILITKQYPEHLRELVTEYPIAL